MPRTPAQSRSSYQKIFAVVRRVPRGRVATYGQVATLAGLHGRARMVGYALHTLSGHTALPWQRVVNASGGISLDLASGGLTQRLLLEREGVHFDARGRVDLRSFQWRPRN